jgi:hypothetical protein
MRGLCLAALLLAAPPAIAAPPEKAPDKATDKAADKSVEKKPELSKEQEQAVIAAYHALKAPEPESKKIEKLPEHEEFARIDVSPRLRSASFGHRTWLLVPPHARHFYVEFGRSTNTPAGLFGPFEVKPATEKGAPEKATSKPAYKTPADTNETRSNGPPAGKTQP